MTALIDLNSRNQGNFSCQGTISFTKDGIPVCHAGHIMASIKTVNATSGAAPEHVNPSRYLVTRLAQILFMTGFSTLEKMIIYAFLLEFLAAQILLNFVLNA